MWNWIHVWCQFATQERQRETKGRERDRETDIHTERLIERVRKDRVRNTPGSSLGIALHRC
jgi:hypothetical protein